MATQSAGRTNRISLPFLARRSLVLRHSDAMISTDAGLLLVRQFDERAGWTKALRRVSP